MPSSDARIHIPLQPSCIEITGDLYSNLSLLSRCHLYQCQGCHLNFASLPINSRHYSIDCGRLRVVAIVISMWPILLVLHYPISISALVWIALFCAMLNPGPFSVRFHTKFKCFCLLCRCSLHSYKISHAFTASATHPWKPCNSHCILGDPHGESTFSCHLAATSSSPSRICNCACH